MAPPVAGLWLGAETVPGRFYPHHPDPAQNTIEQRELFAYRTGPGGVVQKVQITDLFPDIQVNFSNYSHQWSNDGADSFVSLKGIDARGYFQTGNTADLRRVILRIRIRGTGINAAADSGDNPLLGLDDPELEEVVSTPDIWESTLIHAWSPDGNRVAFLQRNLDSYPDLFIKDLTAGSTGLLWDNGASEFIPVFHWSPAGGKFVLSQGSVWTIDAATGAPLQTLLQPAKGTGYDQALVARRHADRD